MMKLKEIEKVTYNLIKTNSTFSLIGLNNEIKLLDNDYYIKELTIRIMENQLKKIEENQGLKIYNLGTGNGYSVLEIVTAFEKASGRQVKYKIAPRRPGDLASCYADPKLAEEELGFKATRNLDNMCQDLWNWQSKNPNGFNSA